MYPDVAGNKSIAIRFHSSAVYIYVRTQSLVAVTNSDTLTPLSRDDELTTTKATPESAFFEVAKKNKKNSFGSTCCFGI